MYNSTVSIYRRIRRYSKKFDYACIELPNGAKCNPDFFWECVRLGILDIDD